MLLPPYATREDVKAELDYKETARANHRIDRVLLSASRDVEGLLHRRFYPVVGTRFFDWPNGQYARSWRLWLDADELISIDSLSSGGTVITADEYLLEPNTSGPPYNRVEINIGTSAAFGGGSTHQRDITITGLWGYRDDETMTGALTGALDSSAGTVLVDADASAQIGVGSVLRVGAERMLVTGRAMTDTGETLGADLAVQNNAVVVAVPDGAAWAVDEVILIGAERMLVVDIAGNTLVVRRAWDGSVLAAHTAGAAIYAPRSLTVVRAALGTTAAAHAPGAPVWRWDPPSPVQELTIAEAVNRLLQGQAGWGKAQKGGLAAKESEQAALTRLREQVYTSHGRKARLRGV